MSKKKLFILAIPIFIEMLLFTLLNTFDTIMLSHYSTDALSSVSSANTITGLFTVLLTVATTGMVIFLTRAIGAKNKDSQNKIISTGLLFNIILGIVLMLLLQLISPLLLKYVTSKSSTFVYDEALIYLRIVSIGVMFTSFSTAIGATFRSRGKPIYVMTTAIITNIINVSINYLLIYGSSIGPFDFPELGVRGAAIGTLTSQCIGMILNLILLKKVFKFKILKMRFNKIHLKQILSIGLPSAFENLLYNLSVFLVVGIAGKILIDGEALGVASRAVALSTLGYVMLFTISFSQANQIILGYMLGENKKQEAVKFTFYTFKIIILVVWSVLILINILYKPIMNIFTDDQRIINAIRPVFFIAFFLEFGRICNVLFIYSLRAVNDVIFPVIMGVISMFGISVLLSALFCLVFDFGIIGIFIAQSLDELFRGTFMMFRWRSKAKNIVVKGDLKYA